MVKATVFTIVDVSEAFHNIILDEASFLLTTFQGHNGRFRYTLGISSWPEEYQRRQQEFLGGLNGVINIADDICIFGCGNTKEEVGEVRIMIEIKSPYSTDAAKETCTIHQRSYNLNPLL